MAQRTPSASRTKKKGSATATPKQVAIEPCGDQDQDVDGPQQRQLLPCGTTVYGHGDFQRLFCCFVILTLIVLQCHSQATSLIARPVVHWYKPPSKFADLSTSRWKNFGIPLDDPASASCRSFWNLVCHRTWLLTLGNAVHMSGALFVVPVAGCMADAYRRKLVIASGVAVLLLSTLGTSFTRSYRLHLVTRFLLRLRQYRLRNLPHILLYEVAPLTYRVFYVGISCSLGVLLVDVSQMKPAAFPLSWYVLQDVILSPTAPLVLATCTVRESPAWLLVLSRVDEAEAIVLEAARMNDVHRVTARQAICRGYALT
ncbi:hypothetical protein HPB52_012339 [Rhipicephalus sanguineus]|uniref:Uncharacterized protein n=1 Tax=Rhipicephalus sanguineus TaxID=34632 RepID=A0A9D4QEL7_RHISA|nr:hypothetical protein HPB52_012339 [Rhipicephalus sanguineus]